MADEEKPLVEGKNISMVGFGKLDSSEREIVKKVIKSYLKKIEAQVDYDELRIRLKTHPKNKTFIHEIYSKLLITPGYSFSAKITHKNPYKALSQAMVKLINEITHQKKKKLRQKSSRKIRRR